MEHLNTTDFKTNFDFYFDNDSLDKIYNRYGGLGELKLDIGCGFNKSPGYIGLDNLSGKAAQYENNTSAPEILINLHSEQFPIPSSSCKEVLTCHYLEHANVDHTIIESHRVLKSGGIFKIIVPYANSAEGMYPGHTIFFTEKWFYLNITFQKHFTIEKLEFKESDYWQNASAKIKDMFSFDQARIFLFNACSEMTLTARVKK